jgi:hypothetical protein
MRGLPKERLGKKTPVRMAHTGCFGGVGGGMGPQGHLRDELSDVLYNSRKYCTHRGISRMEAVWDDRVAAITGASGGGDFHFIERIEIREE